jgi:hypothetical protein
MLYNKIKVPCEWTLNAQDAVLPWASVLFADLIGNGSADVMNASAILE